MFKSFRMINLSALLILCLGTFTLAGETLYNGIELPDQWPPNYGVLKREPMPVPYLDSPPEVINIDVGRQLFVDDFLVEKTTLQRTFHQPEYYDGNPIIKPDKPWENEGPAPFAGPFSGGVWYDSRDKLFKMWYIGSYINYTCYATSKDGIHWDKPELDVVPGTNIVIDHGKGLGFVPSGSRWEEEQRPLDTTSVWIDYDNKDPQSRYKIFYTMWYKDKPDKWHLAYKCSADGIHWSEKPIAISGHVGDHTNAHYNPFRRKWVANIRYYNSEAVGRSRAYVEADDPAEATRIAGQERQGKVVSWLGADADLDPRNPTPHRRHIAPELYHFDAIAYESLMLGYFSILQGPTNDECGELHIQKRNEVLFGYSRDGFHYDRPDRRPVFYATEKAGAWNWGNVQPAGGACIVVGDKLYLYFTARDLPEKQKMWDGFVNTGLAFLRRDGFASMGSTADEGYLTTRPLEFNGNYLFVNTDCDQGRLKVEILDTYGKVIAPFTKENCELIAVDSTLQAVKWKGAKDLSSLISKPVRFRFHLRLGELYSFWVSPDKSGASYGYVGAGGPGYANQKDTVGSEKY